MRYGRSQSERTQRAEPLLPNPVPLPARRRALIPPTRLARGRCTCGCSTGAGAVPVPAIARRADPDLRATPCAREETKRDGRPARPRGWTSAARRATLPAGRRSCRPRRPTGALRCQSGGPTSIRDGTPSIPAGGDGNQSHFKRRSGEPTRGQRRSRYAVAGTTREDGAADTTCVRRAGVASTSDTRRSCATTGRRRRRIALARAMRTETSSSRTIG